MGKLPLKPVMHVFSVEALLISDAACTRQKQRQALMQKVNVAKQ